MLSLKLGQVKATHIEIICEKCNRNGRYRTDKLIAQHGPEIRLPDLKWRLTECTRTIYYDYCGSRFRKYYG